MERDQIKKALEYLRKKDPNNPALQSYEKRLRSLTGASEKSAKGSVELYDYYKENFSSEGQKAKQSKNGNSITDLNGNRQSKGYQKEITRRTEEDSPSFSTYEKAQSELKKKFGIETKGDITYAEAQQLARQKRDKELKEKVKKGTQQKSASSSKKKDKSPSLGKDIKNVLVGAYQFANPFDDVSPKEATERYLKKDTSNTYKEIARGSNRAIDSATLNAMSNLDKRVNDREPHYLAERKFGEGGGIDLVTSGLGYLAPGVGFVKGARAVGLGAKTGTKGLAKAGQLAKEGAVVGGAMAGAEVGIREALNGKNTDWKDNLKHVGMGVGTGAIADPLIHGLGKGVGKGFEKASDKVMKNLMPKDKEFADVVASNLDPKDLWKPKTYALPDGKKVNFKNRVQHELKQTKSQIEEVKPKVEQHEQEFQEAVEQQFEYLKNSMGKGVDYGTTTSGSTGTGNFREINGSFSVSRNPKWYQDFYKLNGRKPTQKELRELAEQHVREGFFDEGGSLPPWAPKKIQEIDDEIDNVVRMMGENPEQADALEPIIKALEEDRSAILRTVEDNRSQLSHLQQNKTALETTLGKKLSLPELQLKKEQPIMEPPKQLEAQTNIAQSSNQQNMPIKPEPITKTQIDDQVRSLDINQGHLNASRREGRISDEEFRQKSRENESKRQQLAEQEKQYKTDIPDELKPMWNNEAKGFVLGDYKTRQVYGGGFYVQKGGQNLGKFRTENEAKRFIQKQVASEMGVDIKQEVDGILSWNSTYDEASKSWDIKAGDYNIDKGDNKTWIVNHKGERVGVYKSEILAREGAQRHLDSNTPKPQQEAVQPQPETVTQQKELRKPIEHSQPVIESKSTVEPPVTQTAPVIKTKPKPNERGFYENVSKRDKTSDEMKQRLEAFDKTYVPMSNKETVDFANAYVKDDIEKAFQFVKNANKFDPRHITVGHRLIDEFQKRGEVGRAIDVAERLAEQGTKHGQSIQSFSIFGRLTAEGQLLRAQRIVNRINQDIPNIEKQVKLDEATVKNITHAADSIQRLTGQEDVAKNVINIMNAIKKGKIATDDELEIIREFVTDAKKFVGDLTPKKERVKVKSADKRTRDKVVDFFNKEEELAKAELRKIMKRANSLPVDFMLYASRYGAAKIAKGMVSFADFTEEMVKDLGEEIRPYMKQVWDKSAELFNLQSDKMTSKRLSDVEKIVNKATKNRTLLPDEANAINKYLDEYLKMTGDAKLEASMHLQSTLQLLERPSFAGRISTAQTIAQLLNPKTIVRNALGNELFYRVEQINKLVATPIDMTKSLLTGSQRTVTFRTHNQGQYWHNWMLGLKAGWKGVNPMGLQTMFDLGPQAFRSKYNPMTYLEKSLGAVLRSFDHAGYMRAYNKSLGEIATLRAMNEGLKGPAKKEAISRYIREADDNMKQIADTYGKYATFQDNTMLATALQKTKKGMNKVSTLGITDEFGLGDLVLKYPKTPGNLIMRALEYSPAGLVRSAHLLKDMKKVKSFDNQREFYLSLSRAITGTAGFSMMGYVLADLGILTSSGHSDFEVASLERSAGKQANSVNITALQRFVASGFNMKEAKTRKDDTFVSYDWAQPVSLAIALGTGVNQSVKEEKEINPLKASQRAFDSATQTIIDMSVLSGLNDFLASYQGRTTSDRITSAIKGLGSSFVPTFSNQVRQMNDNAARTTYSPSFFQEATNKATNRIPGMNQSLPFAYDTLGKQRETYQGGSNNAFNVLLNPSFVSKYRPSEEAQFVLDYINKTGDKSAAPRMSEKKIEGVQLTGPQYAEFQRIQGEETRKRLERLVPTLQKTSNMEKVRKTLKKALDDAADQARKEMWKEMKK
jgi:hypothetical protein